MAHTGGRRRRLITVLTVVLLIALALLMLHLLGMGSAHHEDAGCATCLVVLVAGLTVALAVSGGVAPRHVDPVRRSTPPQRLAITSGRHPPPRGVVLRL